MTTPRQIEANRRNAQKSTGPRTAEGKDRSRFNAVKHGMTAKFDVLPGEDAEAFQGRLDAWMADLQPRNELERELAERANRASWRLERVEQAHVDRLTANILKATSGENEPNLDDVLQLGQLLFQELPEPNAPSPDFAVGPYVPARIVLRLESSAPGCRWLLDRWGELRAALDHRNQAWQSADRFRAIRLLGRQPIDALDDPRVTTVFLACHAIDSSDGELFHEIYNQLSEDDVTIARERLAHRRLEWLRPRDQAEAREVLIQIVERNVAQLEAKFDVHRRLAEIDAATVADRLAFDDSDEGERLRRYELSCSRTLLRTIETFLKIRKAGVSGDSVTSPPAVELGSVTASAAEYEKTRNEPNSSHLRCTRTDASSPITASFAQNEPNLVPSDLINTDARSALEQEMSRNEPNFASNTSDAPRSVSPSGRAITQNDFDIPCKVGKKEIHGDHYRAKGPFARVHVPRSRPRRWDRQVSRGHRLRPRRQPRSRERSRSNFECSHSWCAVASRARARDPCGVMPRGS